MCPGLSPGVRGRSPGAPGGEGENTWPGEWGTWSGVTKATMQSKAASHPGSVPGEARAGGERPGDYARRGARNTLPEKFCSLPHPNPTKAPWQGECHPDALGGAARADDQPGSRPPRRALGARGSGGPRALTHPDTSTSSFQKSGGVGWPRGQTPAYPSAPAGGLTRACERSRAGAHPGAPGRPQRGGGPTLARGTWSFPKVESGWTPGRYPRGLARRAWRCPEDRVSRGSRGARPEVPALARGLARARFPGTAEVPGGIVAGQLGARALLSAGAPGAPPLVGLATVHPDTGELGRFQGWCQGGSTLEAPRLTHPNTPAKRGSHPVAVGWTGPARGPP